MARISSGVDNSDGLDGYHPEAARGLLIWLSGADTDALARCPRERRKLTGVGGAVLTTATMAAASFSFALYTGVRAPLWAAVPVGLLWGLAIMNLDRWLVAAAQRRDRWYQNLTLALPRLLLALIIGVVVSTPLVLWIFQSEINAQLDLIQQRKRAAYEETLRSDPRFAQLPQLRKNIEKNQAIVEGRSPEDAVGKDPVVAHWQREYDKADDLYQKAQKAATDELDGSGGTKVPGVGRAYREKQRIADDLKKRRDAAKARLDSARRAAETAARGNSTKQLASAKAQLEQDLAERDRLLALKRVEHDQFVTSSGQNRGLLARMEALTEFTGQSGTLRTAYLALLLFITAIEILPVLVKFLMSLGPPSLYDRIVRRAEESDAQSAAALLDHERSLTAHELEVLRTHKNELIERAVARKIKSGEHTPGDWRGALPPRAGVVRGFGRRGTGQSSAPRSGRRGWFRRNGSGSTRDQDGVYTPWPTAAAPVAADTRVNGVPRAAAGDGEDEPTRWRYDSA